MQDGISSIIDRKEEKPGGYQQAKDKEKQGKEKKGVTKTETSRPKKISR